MHDESIGRRWNGAARAALAAAVIGCSTGAHAGVDMAGTVNEIQIAPSGALWFGVTATSFSNAGTSTPSATTFCRNSWMSLGLYVPAGDPNYAYYYGLLLASMTKALPIYLGNISTFDGTASCDVTKTGYGVVLTKP